MLSKQAKGNFRIHFTKHLLYILQVAAPDCIADAFLQRRHIVEFLPQDEEERVGEVHVADEVGEVSDDGHVVTRRPRQRIPIHILAPWTTNRR